MTMKHDKHDEEVQLALFCEIVGPYHGLHSDDRYLYAKIGDKVLLFAKGQKKRKRCGKN